MGTVFTQPALLSVTLLLPKPPTARLHLFDFIVHIGKLLSHHSACIAQSHVRWSALLLFRLCFSISLCKLFSKMVPRHHFWHPFHPDRFMDSGERGFASSSALCRWPFRYRRFGPHLQKDRSSPLYFLSGALLHHGFGDPRTSYPSIAHYSCASYSPRFWHPSTLISLPYSSHAPLPSLCDGPKMNFITLVLWLKNLF